jgi:cyclic dehypoxanthinyl futalosine synthase
MSLTKVQALEMFRSDDLIGIGMEADAVRKKLHPDGVVTYVIDRNINYTNFCTEYCTFCAFYRPLKGKLAAEGYVLDFETIYEKIRETVELGGTGVLMQGGLHPDLRVDWHERLLRDEVDRGRLDLPADLHDVAYVIVRLIESYCYLDLITGEKPEARRAEPILRMLLR